MKKGSFHLNPTSYTEKPAPSQPEISKLPCSWKEKDETVLTPGELDGMRELGRLDSSSEWLPHPGEGQGEAASL